jgi:hypothetical protein
MVSDATFFFILMATKHLKYANNDPIRLNVTGLVELTDVITSIKTYYGEDIPGPAARIKLKYNNGTFVTDLDDVSAQYYLKLKETGALALEIYLKPQGIS